MIRTESLGGISDLEMLEVTYQISTKYYILNIVNTAKAVFTNFSIYPDFLVCATHNFFVTLNEYYKCRNL